MTDATLNNAGSFLISLGLGKQRIYLSIGSNLGDRLAYIQNALALLKTIGFKLIKQSPIIETLAILPPGAPTTWDLPYFNMVVAGTFEGSVQQLSEQLQIIETTLGKVRSEKRWAPRTIDLDILLIDDQFIKQENLTVPHSELLNRPFLIHLLALIAPNFKYPGTETTFTELAHQLKHSRYWTHSLVATPQFVGIVNITPDSFSDGGLFFRSEKAIEQTWQLQREGASIIELGAQSTRPGASKMNSVEEEYQRLYPVLDTLQSAMQTKQLRISIDTFCETTVLKILKQFAPTWINDVKGHFSDSCLAQIADAGCNFIAMHSLSIPQNAKYHIPFQASPIKIVMEWAEKKIFHLIQCGFKQEQIILDPGIGYGKTPYQNLSLLRQLSELRTLGCPILVGHSRKLFISTFSQQAPAERDLETIAISHYLTKLPVDYLRVHNVAAHQRFMVANNLCDMTYES